MQKIMICTTYRKDVRAEIDGWSFEDGDCVYKAYHERLNTKHQYDHPNLVPVGLIGGYQSSGRLYPTILHAIGDGWKLLSPPQEEKMHDNLITKCFTWYLVKD